MKLAVLADIHFDPNAPGREAGRITDAADILLERAVRRLNRFDQADFVLIAGDLCDAGVSGSEADYGVIRSILDKLEMPWAAIPGNHDCASDRFYKLFPSPGRSMDVKGVRFAFYLDADAPGFHAVRSPVELNSMNSLRSDGWSGPIVAVQHVPVFPDGATDCPYWHLDSASIIEAMQRNRISAALAGHYHSGFAVEKGGILYAGAPALCEEPFRYLLLEIDENGASQPRVEQLAMPKELKLQDLHIHTQLAYCSENMDVRKTLRLAKLFGMADIRFTEHSGHLLFKRERYATCFDPSVGADPAQSRVAAYHELLAAAGIPPAKRGMEIDGRYDGSAVATREMLDGTPFKLGAVHSMRTLARGSSASPQEIAAEFMRINEGLCALGIQVLAHPFRIFRRASAATPDALYGPLAQLLKRHGVAAELNFHTNEPPVEFLRVCLEEGVRTTFGSDAHNLCEIGDFAPHLRLLAEAGFNGYLDEALLRVE